MPLLSGSQLTRRLVGDAGLKEHLAKFDRARQAEARGEGVQYQQHSSNPETPDYFARADKGKTWRNKITVASHAMVMEYERDVSLDGPTVKTMKGRGFLENA